MNPSRELLLTALRLSDDAVSAGTPSRLVRQPARNRFPTVRLTSPQYIPARVISPSVGPGDISAVESLLRVRRQRCVVEGSRHETTDKHITRA